MLQKVETVEYSSISKVLSSVINANVYITDRDGKIFGFAFVDDFECDLMVDKVIAQEAFPAYYANWLLKADETSANLRAKSGMCAFAENTECMYSGKNTTIVPIYGVGERIGTLILAKYDDDFTDDDLLLAEYGATVVGMEMLRDYTKKNEVETRKRETVRIAVDTLSYSEVTVAYKILSKIDGTEGRLVASKIVGDENSKKEHGDDGRDKITRSVVVNALRKLESAGIIKSTSLGMKGTHIKVFNEYLLDAVKKKYFDLHQDELSEAE